MVKNQKRTLAIPVIVLIAFSVISFAIPFRMNGLFWLSYLFGVLAIAVQIYVMNIAFRGTESVKSKFYGFPIAQIGIIYMAVQLILSLIFMALAAVAPIWIAVVLYVIVLAVAAIGFIGADTVRDEIERQEIKLENHTQTIRTLTARVSALAVSTGDPDIQKLAEEFRYSDPVSGPATKALEDRMYGIIAELESNNKGQTAILCREISGVLAERNRICRLGKKR